MGAAQNWRAGWQPSPQAKPANTCEANVPGQPPAARWSDRHWLGTWNNHGNTMALIYGGLFDLHVGWVGFVTLRTNSGMHQRERPCSSIQRSIHNCDVSCFTHECDAYFMISGPQTTTVLYRADAYRGLEVLAVDHQFKLSASASAYNILKDSAMCRNVLSLALKFCAQDGAGGSSSAAEGAGNSVTASRRKCAPGMQVAGRAPRAQPACRPSCI